LERKGEIDKSILGVIILRFLNKNKKLKIRIEFDEESKKITVRFEPGGMSPATASQILVLALQTIGKVIEKESKKSKEKLEKKKLFKAYIT